MSKSIAIPMTTVAAIAIVVASLAAATDVYGQNITTIQQQELNLTNTTNTTMTTATTTIPIFGLNAIIINAINAKIKSIYDHGNIDIQTNSEAAIITKIDNKNTVR